jgi:glycosyltransferase involved in cell wall biosynthesis
MGSEFLPLDVAPSFPFRGPGAVCHSPRRDDSGSGSDGQQWRAVDPQPRRGWGVTGRPRRVAVLVKGYPRLSETFIAQEVLALERLGLDLEIISLRQPTDGRVHELHRRIRAPVRYLPEYLYQEPLRVLAALGRQLFRRRLRRLLALWLADLRRDPTANRGRRLGQALVLAAELPGEVDWLHVHYLHTPASVARYAAILRDLPFSISAHAKDVWTIPDWEKREKIAAARWLVTCSRMNLDHLRTLAPGADLELVHHGLEATRFPAPRRERGGDGADPDRPVRIVCVARAVEKKGLDVLLDALACLPRGLHWRFEHLGGGPRAGELADQARRLGLGDRVAWRGAATQDEVLGALRRADLFCLAARVAGDGDRDGVPNVVMEAMSQELPVVATEVGAIPEVVVPGVTGRLVPPEAPGAFGQAVEDLVRDPECRLAMGAHGRRRIVERFAFEAGVERLARRFGLDDTRREAA